MLDAARFEVTSAEVAVASRRLTTAAAVRAALKDTSSTYDTLIESIIDRVSADCVNYCNLARDIAGKQPTFISETLRATWLVTGLGRDHQLILPWRAPITAITSVVEDGVTLDAADYQLTTGGILERVNVDAAMAWSAAKIVVVYVAGVTAGSIPPELEGQVIEQCKMRYKSTVRDPSIRSENMPDVWSGSYAVAGGDSIGESGLLKSLEEALGPYRAVAV